MAIYSGFSHWKWWFSNIFHSYVSLPEGKTQDMQRIQRETWGETTTEFGDRVLRQASDGQ